MIHDVDVEADERGTIRHTRGHPAVAVAPRRRTSSVVRYSSSERRPDQSSAAYSGPRKLTSSSAPDIDEPLLDGSTHPGAGCTAAKYESQASVWASKLDHGHACERRGRRQRAGAMPPMSSGMTPASTMGAIGLDTGGAAFDIAGTMDTSP
jgi:hypothetical protein